MIGWLIAGVLLALTSLVGYLLGRFKPLDEVTLELVEMNEDGARHTKDIWLATGDEFSISDGRGRMVWKLDFRKRGRMTMYVMTDEGHEAGYRLEDPRGATR